MHKKLYKEDRKMREERDRIYIENKLLSKIEDTLEWTFQPNVERYSNDQFRTNSKLTGTFYERSLLWKEKQDKWIEEEQKKKTSKLKKEIRKNHIETMRYSERHSRNASFNNRATWLTYAGVATHLERQFNAQKEKQVIEQLKESGKHRNVKKKIKNSRVTIPKKKYNRKYIREAMDVIEKQAIPSARTNQHLTTRDLASKGFTYRDVIAAANDLESETIDKMRSQFYDKEAIHIDNNTRYKSALETLHKYLHSFDL